MHWGGITDRDVETLRKIYPNFNWEKAWDRTRWLSAEKQKQERRSREKARQSFQPKKE